MNEQSQSLAVIQALSGDSCRYLRRSVEVVHSHLGADVHPQSHIT